MSLADSGDDDVPTAGIAAHRWQPGQSGNPSGKPKQLPELRSAIRDMTPRLLQRLSRISRDPKAPGPAVAAIRLLLAYGWGTPDTQVNVAVTHQRIPDIESLPSTDLRRLLRTQLQRVVENDAADDTSEG